MTVTRRQLYIAYSCLRKIYRECLRENRSYDLCGSKHVAATSARCKLRHLAMTLQSSHIHVEEDRKHLLGTGRDSMKTVTNLQIGAWQDGHELPFLSATHQTHHYPTYCSFFPFLLAQSMRSKANALRKREARITTSVAASAPPARFPPKAVAAATLAPASVSVVAMSNQPWRLILRDHFHPNSNVSCEGSSNV